LQLYLYFLLLNIVLCLYLDIDPYMPLYDLDLCLYLDIDPNMPLYDLDHDLCLYLDIDPNMPLPPPKHAATTLKTQALKAVQQWQDKYGEAYKKLALGYNFLKTCKQVRTMAGECSIMGTDINNSILSDKSPISHILGMR
jgi:hypothetical protein